MLVKCNKCGVAQEVRYMSCGVQIQSCTICKHRFAVSIGPTENGPGTLVGEVDSIIQQFMRDSTMHVIYLQPLLGAALAVLLLGGLLFWWQLSLANLLERNRELVPLAVRQSLPAGPGVNATVRASL